MDFKDRMIDAMDRGVPADEAYGYVRESLADAADRARDEQDERRTVIHGAKSEAPASGKFLAVVVVEADTREQAEMVLRERLGHDEDYGFNYRIGWSEVENA